MTEETTLIRIYKTDHERLKNRGRAGDSMAKVVNGILNIVEMKV
jgi:hypothetical protein